MGGALRTPVTDVRALRTARRPRLPVYTIEGVRPGMTLAQVAARLGQPVRKSRFNYYLDPWFGPGVAHESGIVTAVRGESLERDGQPCLKARATERDRRRHLGKPLTFWNKAAVTATSGRKTSSAGSPSAATAVFA